MFYVFKKRAGLHLEVWGLADFLRFSEAAMGLVDEHTWTMGSAGQLSIVQ